MPSYAPVAALVRGLAVLRAISAVGSASIKDLHERTGLDKATIVRMVETLVDQGFVRSAADGSYRVTGRVLQLSEGFELTAALAEHAAPILSRFRMDVGWPSDIAICDGDAMILVGSTREAGPMSFNRRVGFRAPILTTSLGKAYLAHCGEAERRRILDHLLATGATGATGATADEGPVLEHLDTVRERGFAVMDAAYSATEYNGRFWAMAVPVRGATRLYAALNIMLLTDAVSMETAIAQYLGPLRGAADRLADAFEAAGI